MCDRPCERFHDLTPVLTGSQCRTHQSLEHTVHGFNLPPGWPYRVRCSGSDICLPITAFWLFIGWSPNQRRDQRPHAPVRFSHTRGECSASYPASKAAASLRTRFNPWSSSLRKCLMSGPGPRSGTIDRIDDCRSHRGCRPWEICVRGLLPGKEWRENGTGPVTINRTCPLFCFPELQKLFLVPPNKRTASAA